MATTWTNAQLQALEDAIAQGTLRVEYEGKMIMYRSLDEMLRLRSLMRKSLTKATSDTTRIRAVFSKGLD